MPTVYDLELINDDLAFGADGEPRFVSDVEAIAQDIRHRLRERGLLAELVADDQPSTSVERRIAAEVEEDERIVPGTARATLDGATLTISANTILGVALAESLELS